MPPYWTGILLDAERWHIAPWDLAQMKGREVHLWVNRQRALDKARAETQRG